MNQEKTLLGLNKPGMLPDSQHLANFIRDKGLRPRQNSISYIFDCPRCGKANKLYLRKKDGRFVCWVCRDVEGYQGRAEYALADLAGIPVREVRAFLYGGISSETPGLFFTVKLKDFFGENDEIAEEAPSAVLHPLCFPPDIYSIGHSVSHKGRSYLSERGISLSLAISHRLHYQPSTQRVIFPVIMEGQLYGWQARTIHPDVVYDPETDQEYRIPKILGNKGLRRELLLMFADALQNSPHCVLAEGPVDAIKASACGGAVATMGKSVSLQQIELIRNAGISKLYVALDPDAARETMRLSERLGDMELYLLRPPPCRKDLGDCTPEEVYQEFLRAPRLRAGHVVVYFDPKAERRAAALGA